jgi:hypothetical protein
MGHGHRRIEHNAQVKLTSLRDMHERPLALTGLEYQDGPGPGGLRSVHVDGNVTACPPADHSQPALARATGATCSGQSTKKRRLGIHARHRPSSDTSCPFTPPGPESNSVHNSQRPSPGSFVYCGLF